MFATVRQARAMAFAGAVLLGGAPCAAASDRLNDKPLPQFDFTLLSSATVVPAAATAMPLASMTDLSLEPKSGPLAEAAQTRPVDLIGPRGDGAFSSASLRRSMYVSFAALQVFDAISTRKALNAGAREANPAMAAVVKSNTALLAVKAGSAAATAFFAERLAKKHPRRAAIVMTVLNTAYAAVVAHNYRVAQNAR